jgi:hypothetical protein
MNGNMGNKATEAELIERVATRIGEEFAHRFAAFAEQEADRNRIWQENIDAILDDKLGPIRADLADLNSDMKTVKAVVRENSLDTKEIKRDIKALNTKVYKLDRYTEDIESHEIRLTKLEQAHHAA